MMQASKLNKIKVISAMVALVFAYNAHAKLQSLDDGKLENIAGAEGIGIILDDIQVQAEKNATLNISFDADTIFLYGNQFKIFKYQPKIDSEGGFVAAPTAISEGSGFTIGSASDPIKLDIMSVNDLNDNKTYYNTKNTEISPSANVDIRFLRLALPTADTLQSDKTLDQRSAQLKDQTNAAHLPSRLGKSTYAYGDKMKWTTVPFNCSGSAPKCLSLAIRLRADIYRTSYAQSNSKKLQERLILWARADGVNLNGTYFDIWADSDTGMSLSANASIYINELQFTSRTNTQDNPQYQQSDMQLTDAAKAVGETKESLRLTLPYADKDTAAFIVTEGTESHDTGLKMSGVYADLHLGNKFYQPLMLRSVLTAVDRSEPTGTNMEPDSVRSDLSVQLPAITKETSVRFYKDEQNKSNIHVREIKMGAGANKNGYNIVNANGYNFGSLTVEGLRVQQLKFTTRELKPLTANHCPNGWDCSFR